MKLDCQMTKRGMRALTRVDVLACIGVALMLVWVFAPSFLGGNRKKKSTRIRCVNNLKNIALGARIFAADHNDRLPMSVPLEEGGSQEYRESFRNVWRHFAVLSNELSTPKLLVCPDDAKTRIVASSFAPARSSRPYVTNFWQNANLSYFLGVDAQAYGEMFWAGDRNLTNSGPSAIRGREARLERLGAGGDSRQNPGWDEHTHRHQGNVVLADGSALQLSNAKLGAALQKTGDAGNRVAIPD